MKLPLGIYIAISLLVGFALGVAVTGSRKGEEFTKQPKREISPGTRPSHPASYRPEVPFHVTMTEEEVANIVLKPSMNDPAGQMLMQSLEFIEQLVLSTVWDEQEWQSHWESYANSAGTIGVRKIDQISPQNTHSFRVKLWLVWENARLVLLSYKPRLSHGLKAELVKKQFRNGAGIIKEFLDDMPKSPEWTQHDEKTIHGFVTSYKIQVYQKKNLEKSP